jgi:5-methyltetrahydrofolate--homocysteine methyltransferase
VLKDVPLEQIWEFVNSRMLLGKHLGIKGSLIKFVEDQNWAALKDSEGGEKVIDVLRTIDGLKNEWKKKSFRPKAVFRFYEAASSGNQVHIYSRIEAERLRRAPAEPKLSPQPLVTFDFPRQLKPNGLCLSDYLNPLGSIQPDNVCFFVVTAGEGIRPWAEELKSKGEYLKCHVLQALALETAEAFAEFLHGKIRAIWGFSDDLQLTMMDRFQAKYRGKRYSFGYPACPVLDDQAKLFELLKPEDIGVDLTEGFMMDPEASVSAVVFSHPAATYFGVGGQ